MAAITAVHERVDHGFTDDALWYDWGVLALQLTFRKAESFRQVVQDGRLNPTDEPE